MQSLEGACTDFFSGQSGFMSVGSNDTKLGLVFSFSSFCLIVSFHWILHRRLEGWVWESTWKCLSFRSFPAIPVSGTGGCSPALSSCCPFSSLCLPHPGTLWGFAWGNLRDLQIQERQAHFHVNASLGHPKGLSADRGLPATALDRVKHFYVQIILFPP